MPTVYNKHKPYPKEAIYIGRGSPFGNNYSHLPSAHTKAQFKVATRQEAIDSYITNLTGRDKAIAKYLLQGKDLLCYCSPLPCHGDYLMTIANDPKQPTIIPNFIANHTDVTTQVIGDFLLNNYQWNYKQNRGELNFGKSYSYGNHKANKIPDQLQQLIDLVNEVTGFNFNQLYCNYYVDGSVGLGEHSDNEPEHKHHTIACLSLGETRTFILNRERILLKDDDLILFDGLQRHSIPKDNSTTGRISLTFREFK